MAALRGARKERRRGAAFGLPGPQDDLPACGALSPDRRFCRGSLKTVPPSSNVPPQTTWPRFSGASRLWQATIPVLNCNPESAETQPAQCNAPPPRGNAFTFHRLLLTVTAHSSPHPPQHSPETRPQPRLEPWHQLLPSVSRSGHSDNSRSLTAPCRDRCRSHPANANSDRY
jgi:hypothetical protein